MTAPEGPTNAAGGTALGHPEIMVGALVIGYLVPVNLKSTSKVIESRAHGRAVGHEGTSAESGRAAKRTLDARGSGRLGQGRKLGGIELPTLLTSGFSAFGLEILGERFEMELGEDALFAGRQNGAMWAAPRSRRRIYASTRSIFYLLPVHHPISIFTFAMAARLGVARARRATSCARCVHEGPSRWVRNLNGWQRHGWPCVTVVYIRIAV